MSDRALRGSRLGTQSFEDERGVEMAPRQQVSYLTESGHEFHLTLSAEAGPWLGPWLGRGWDSLLRDWPSGGAAA
jgi:hypothetical protein